MACSKMISFAEIVQGRDASVRVTEDRLLYAVDLAVLGTGQSRDDAAQVSIPSHALCMVFANQEELFCCAQMVSHSFFMPVPT